MDKIRELWNKLVALVCRVPYDKWLHVIAGLMLCAFFAISLGWKCVLPVALVAGLLKEVFDWFTTKNFDCWDWVATICGGFAIQVFVWLGLWWL